MGDTPAAGTPPAAAGAPAAGTPVAPAAPESIYTLKVNGQDRQYTLDQLKQAAGKADGLEGRVKEADQLEKAWAGFLATTLEDPTALFSHPTLKDKFDKKLLKEKMGRWYYENFIEPEQLDPKERELRELKAQAAENEKKAREYEERARTEKEQAAVKGYWDDYRGKIGAAMKAEGLPEHESVVQRTARYLYLALRSNQKMEVVDAVKRVKADLVQESIDRFKGMDEDGILSFLPPEIAEKVNKAFLKKFKKEESEKNKANPPADRPAVRRNVGRRSETLDQTRKADKLLSDMSRGKF